MNAKALFRPIELFLEANPEANVILSGDIAAQAKANDAPPTAAALRATRSAPRLGFAVIRPPVGEQFSYHGNRCRCAYVKESVPEAERLDLVLETLASRVST